MLIGISFHMQGVHTITTPFITKFINCLTMYQTLSYVFYLYHLISSFNYPVKEDIITPIYR